MKNLFRLLATIFVLTSLLLVVGACEKKEKTLEDKIHDAGDAIEDAADDVGDSMEDAAEDIEESVEDATDSLHDDG